MACRCKTLFGRTVVRIPNADKRQRFWAAFLGKLCQIFHRKDVVRLLKHVRHLLSQHFPDGKLSCFCKGDSVCQLCMQLPLHLWMFQRIRCLLQQRQLGILRTKRQNIHASHRTYRLHSTKCKSLSTGSSVADRQLHNQVRSVLQRCRCPHPLGKNRRCPALGKIRTHHHGNMGHSLRPQLFDLPAVSLVERVIFCNDRSCFHSLASPPIFKHFTEISADF